MWGWGRPFDFGLPIFGRWDRGDGAGGDGWGDGWDRPGVEMLITLGGGVPSAAADGKPPPLCSPRYLKEIMTSISEKRKFLTAIGLSYVLCLLIMWDSTERARSIKILLATWAIALSFDVVLYLIRRKYESNRMIRLIFAAGLLISYVIYGLTFRSLIHNAYFIMTMAVFIFIGSFIVDILQSDELGVPKEEDNQEDTPDPKTVR